MTRSSAKATPGCSRPRIPPRTAKSWRSAPRRNALAPMTSRVASSITSRFPVRCAAPRSTGPASRSSTTAAFRRTPPPTALTTLRWRESWRSRCMSARCPPSASQSSTRRHCRPTPGTFSTRAASRRSRDPIRVSQDFHEFLVGYRKRYPDDVFHVTEEASPDQEATALAWALAAQGRAPMLVLERVAGTKVVTNVFSSRARIARILGCDLADLHKTYQAKARRAMNPKLLRRGPVLDIVEKRVDLTKLPLLRHFETDKAPYITN